MALQGKSLFLYGFDVTANNRYIDFKISGGGSQLTATLNQGSYSLSQLLTEIVRAMQAADTANTYTATVDRTTSSGTANRVTIATTGSFLLLLFSTGTHATSSLASLIGFAATDRTGATTYTGTATAGTILITSATGYNAVKVPQKKKVFGTVNVSASGLKESLVFQLQRFFEVEFMYEPESRIETDWLPFWEWAIQQKPYDFTPDYENSPSSFYSVTLDGTPQDSQGLAFEMSEMLPNFPFFYRTGKMKMRLT